MAVAAFSSKVQPPPGSLRVSQRRQKRNSPKSPHFCTNHPETILVQAEKRCFACSKHLILEGAPWSTRVGMGNQGQVLQTLRAPGVQPVSSLEMKQKVNFALFFPEESHSPS